MKTWAGKTGPESLVKLLYTANSVSPETPADPDSSSVPFSLNIEANLGFISFLPLNSLINSSYYPTNTRAVSFLFPQHTFGKLPPFAVSRMTDAIFLSLHEPEDLPLTAPNSLFIFLKYSSGLSQLRHPRMASSPLLQVQQTI